MPKDIEEEDVKITQELILELFMKTDKTLKKIKQRAY
jgi:hypothetical protein